MLVDQENISPVSVHWALSGLARTQLTVVSLRVLKSHPRSGLE